MNDPVKSRRLLGVPGATVDVAAGEPTAKAPEAALASERARGAATSPAALGDSSAMFGAQPVDERLG